MEDNNINNDITNTKQEQNESFYGSQMPGMDMDQTIRPEQSGFQPQQGYYQPQQPAQPQQGYYQPQQPAQPQQGYYQPQQPPYQPVQGGYYTQPVQGYYGQPQQTQKGRGKGIAAMVCGICSIVFCWLFYFGIPLGIIGLCLGASSRKDDKTNGIATAGVITGAIGLGLSVLIFVLIIASVGALGEIVYDDAWSSMF